MRFDRKQFFDGYKAKIGNLTQTQVDGLNSLLSNYEKYSGWWDDIDQIGNSLSQVGHESAHSFQPVVEGFYLGDSTQPKYFQGNTDRVKRFQQSLRYYPFFGMGHIQLTWAENYRKLDQLVRKYFPEIVQQFEIRTGRKFDLANVPTQALDDDVSFAVMTIGMHKGTFRAGQTLDRYIGPGGVDHFGAREIVNGDKNYRIKGSNVKIGNQIASDAKKFASILRASLIGGDILELPNLVSAEAPAVVPTDNTVERAELLSDEQQESGATTPNTAGESDLPENKQPPTSEQNAETIINTGDTQADTEPVEGGGPNDEAQQASTGGSKSLIGTILGGLAASGTAIWSAISDHIDGVVVGVICVTILIMTLIFRQVLLDWLRMKLHADRGKANVK